MKQEWVKGWKVIRINCGESRVSCTSDGHEVLYEKDKITGRPENCGPLAVFKTREVAREFKRRFWYHWRGCRIKIVKCLYKKSEDTYLWYDGSYCDHNHRPTRRELPKGTDFADEVKCLE